MSDTLLNKVFEIKYRFMQVDAGRRRKTEEDGGMKENNAGAGKTEAYGQTWAHGQTQARIHARRFMRVSCCNCAEHVRSRRLSPEALIIHLLY